MPGGIQACRKRNFAGSPAFPTTNLDTGAPSSCEKMETAEKVNSCLLKRTPTSPFCLETLKFHLSVPQIPLGWQTLSKAFRTIMLALKKFDNIYLYRPFADFRKGISGLCGIVQDQMELNPFENYLFIFCNTRRDRIKILYWDQTGFAMWYKVLEKDKYWPAITLRGGIRSSESAGNSPVFEGIRSLADSPSKIIL